MATTHGHKSREPQLAIANLDRKILEGPHYLDDLVQSDSHEDMAVEYLDADGTTSRISFASLQQASRNLALRIHESKSISTRSNTIIPTILSQGPLLYLSYLGTLRAGAAFCPILPDTPDERLQFILNDVQAEFVLCTPEIMERLENLSPSIRCISVTLDRCLKSCLGTGTMAEQTRDTSDIAYVMYTSGSTGKPKGVPVSHHAITQSLLAHEEHIPVFQRFFQFAAPTFDVSIFEIFFPWFRGATLVSREREETLADLCGTIRRLEVDAIELTPTVVTTLLRKRNAVPALKLLLTIGEMLTPQIIEEFGQSKSQPGVLYAMYGPTEAAVHCTIVPNMERSSSVRDIGRPLSTVTAFILGESSDSQDVRILHCGQPGELAIAGQLADGYLNRPTQTKSAFVSLPEYGTVYRTGDRATMLPNGTLQMMGRISDGQVKLRGQRVELGEVESVALQIDGIDLAVAIVVQDTLVLFCCGRSDLESTQIEQRCKAWLPRHMRPGRIVLLADSIPRLPSGKIDRKQLETIFHKRSETNLSSDPDSGGASLSWVSSVISEELGIAVDDQQTLWSTGLTSLRGIKIASRLREHFPKVSIATVLEADNISHLVTMLESQDEEMDKIGCALDADAQDSQYVDVLKSVQEKWYIANKVPAQVLPCSAIQIAMLAETSRNSILNLNEIVLTANSPVTLSQIIDSVKAIAEKNSILRSAFEPTGDPNVPFVQIVKDDVSFKEKPSMQHPLSICQGQNDKEFIFTVHHALYDGWSWDLVMKDLNTCLRGGALPARPSFQSFSKLILQRSRVHYEADLMEWTDLLRDVDFPQFPTLCCAPSAATGPPCHSTTFSTSSERLSAVAQDLGVNMATIIHTALSLLLAKYLDTDDVVTGLVLSGREPVMPDVGEMIGPCLSTLPLLARLAESTTILVLMQQIYQQYMNCLRRQATSLSDIANALSLDQDTQIFDVLFVWQESPYPSDPKVDAIVTTATYDHLEYALVVEVEPQGNSVKLKTTYDKTKLCLDQVECLHSQIDALVEHCVRNPNVSLNSIWEALPQPLLSLSQDPDQPVPDDLTSMLVKAASQFPDRTAIDFVEDFNPTTKRVTRKTTSYRELFKKAARIASKLINIHGLARDDTVAICCKKSPDLYFIICATILAGVPYLCIDPNTPDNRVQEILLQANAKVVVLDNGHNTVTKSNATWSVESLDELAEDKLGDERDLEVYPSGSDLAYAVFTSGSTGVPKGVLITRENLASNLRHLVSIYPYKSSSRFLQSCSQAFDVSVFEIFWTWCCGLTLCTSTNDILFRDIELFIDSMDITHLSMTPSVAALVNPSSVPKVEFLVCAGEPMSAKVYKAWAGRGLHQGYGPSETTNICNVRHYAEGLALINNVGPAFPNTSIFVCSRRSRDRIDRVLLPEDLQILPRGANGEIWIGGQQVGRGYTDPELTDRTFLDHPTYGRLFKSGDFGRMLPDGSLIITGREDDQVKIRGQRVELKEVDSILMQSVQVWDSFTTILGGEHGRQKLVNFWVHKDGPTNDPERLVRPLYDQLRDVLPSYMVPESLILLPKLPLTSQGKVDKCALTAMYNALDHAELAVYTSDHPTLGAPVMPSETERSIIEILANMACVPTSDINTHSSFFGYGIDSIRAIAFAKRLKESNIANIDVSTILKHPTVSRLASVLTESNIGTPEIKDDVAAEAIPSSLRESVTMLLKDRGFTPGKILPCTPLQTAMLSTHETSTAGAYLNHLVYHLVEDPITIRQAWAAMVSRIDLLRTMFVLTDDAEHPYLQIVLRDFQLPWLDTGCDHLNGTSSPFDGPPYLLHLKTSNSQTELHLFIHHALYDAEAMAHLQSDIETHCLGGSLVLRPQFSTYLNFMLGVDVNVSGKFWKRVLKNFTPSFLQELQPQSSSSRNHATRNRQHAKLWKRVSSCAKATSTTPLTVFQTALARLLARHANSTDICFGTVFSGRNIDVPDIDKIIGPCFNTLPSRIHLRSAHTNNDTCRRFHAYNISLLPYQATSLRDLQREFCQSGTPLFDVLLLFQSVTPSQDARIWTKIHESGHMAFPFILEVQYDIRSDIIEFYLHNNTSASSRFLDDVLKQFVELVIDTVEHQYQPTLDKVLSDDSPRRMRGQHPIRANSHARTNGHTQQVQDTYNSRKIIERVRSMAKKTFSAILPSTTIFHLGLDSISTVQLAAQLRRDGFHVSAGELLDRPRIHDIVKMCEQRQGTESLASHDYDIDAFDEEHRIHVAERLNRREVEIKAVWPCTATQLGILSEYTKSNGSHYYNSVRLRLEPCVNATLLREKLEDLIEVHDMLRIGFLELDNVEMPFAMVLYSRIDADIRSESNTTVSREPSTYLPRDISRPPWHIEFHHNANGASVELHMLHALYDAQSLETMLHDLAALYQGLPVARPVSIGRALSLIVADNKAERDIWGLLGCNESEVEMTKFPDLNISQNVRRCALTATLDLEIERKVIQSQCETLACSVSTAFQAAWAQLLAVYTGQDSVVFGSVLSGRSFEMDELDNVAFPCINTLPIFVNIANTQVPIIEQVAKANARWQKSPHVPLAKIKRACGIEGDIFDTIIALRKPQQTDINSPWRFEAESASAEYAVSLEIIPTNDKFELLMTYTQALVPPEHGPLLLKQYEMVLYEMLTLSKEEPATTHRLYSVKPPLCEVIEPDTNCLHDLVLSTAARFPHNIALESITNMEGEFVHRRTWTYRQLVAEASRVANLLVKYGSCTADMVAICCEKSAQASFALLGILMAGCTYVAIDPSSPASRKDFIVKDAKCQLILTTSSVANSFELHEDVVLLCIDDGQLLCQQSTSFNTEAHHPSLQDVCYCLYTSGTTGTPKGCLITHQSAVQAMKSFSRIFEGHWSSESRWLQFASYHFDVSVLEHFWSWKEGMRVSIIPRDLLFEDLPGSINKVGITHLDLTPSLARLLSPGTVPSLCQGVFIVGGEQVRQDIIDTWGDAGCLYNFYGPSEVTIGCTVRARVRKGVKATNIGHQWDNVGTFVLEPDTEKLVPIGAVGELCLSGVLVGKGYLNRQELTAEKFVVLKATKERVYRTGDLVRMLHDNSFEFLGRVDDQVKLRGQRLEIGEINHTILQCSTGFEDAATVVAQHPQQEKPHLISFLAQKKDANRKQAELQILLGEASPASLSKIRSQLADRLPAYMIPTYFVALKFLPLTVNNKVDLKAVKSMYRQTSLSEIRTQQNRYNDETNMKSKAYSRLFSVVATHLGVDKGRINLHDSLLQLGIDSISAIGLVRALKKAGYANVSVPMILRRPIIADLAAKCCDSRSPQADIVRVEQVEASKNVIAFAKRHENAIGQALRLQRNAIENIAPCTALQEGMISRLLMDDLEQPPYMAKFVYELDSNINLTQLQLAWTTMQEHLDILRTYFVSTNDGFAQVVLTPTDERLLKVDLRTMTVATDPLKRIDEHFRSWAQTAKALGPIRPWEARIISRGSNESHYMSIFMFHGLYDGISVDLMLRYLHQVYDNPQKRHNAPLFYEALALGPLLHKRDSSSFWSQHLQSVHLLNLPKSCQSVESGRHVNELQFELAAPEVQQICTALAVTPQAAFHATWLRTIAQEFKFNPTIGIVLSGRSIELENADEIIGPMFNTLPFQINQFPQSACFADLIQACHRSNVDVLPYQHTSLSSIRKSLQLRSDQDMFDSLFVYQNATKNEESSQWRWDEIQIESSVEYPLNLEIEKLDTHLYGVRIVADAKSLKSHDVAKLSESLKKILQSLSASLKGALPACFYDDTKSTLRPKQHVIAATQSANGRVRWTKHAERVRTVLASLVSVDEAEVGLDTPTIFELGLDSVDALKLAAQLKDKEILVSVSKILRNPTVAGIVAQHALSQASSSRNHALSLPFGDMQTTWREQLERQGHQHKEIEWIMPTTPLQQGMLLEFEDYYYTMTFSVSDDVDISRLIRAIHESVRMMAVLRTKFVTVDNAIPGKSTFWQLVAKPQHGGRKPQISHYVKDTNDLKKFAADIRRNAEIVDSAPRFNVVCLEDGKNFLVLGLSHASYDAWSIQLILHYLQMVYTDSDSLADDTQSIAEYVNSLQQERNSSEATNFWSHRLSDAIPSLVHVNPSDTSLPALLKERFASSPLKQAQAASRRYGITLQSLAAATWALCLMTLTHQLDVSFGVVVSGRTDEKTEHLCFPTFNTVVLRACIEPQMAKHDVLQKFHNLIMDMFEYQRFPLSKALGLAQKHGSGLFNTLFTFQRTPTMEANQKSLVEEVDSGDHEVSPPYAINVEVQEKDGRLSWTIAIQQGVMSAERLENVFDALDHVLESLITLQDGNVFEERDSDMSICGLPSFKVQQKVASSHEMSLARSPAFSEVDQSANLEWSDVESQIRNVFSEVSGTDLADMTRSTSLYHLGLDSVSAIRISGLLKASGLKVPVSMILRNQTIAKIASSIQKVQELDVKPAASEREPGGAGSNVRKSLDLQLQAAGVASDDVEDILPATGGQVYMLDMWRASKRSLFYATFSFEVQYCNRKTFQTAFDQLVQEVPALRTKFMVSGGMSQQVIFRPTSKVRASMQYGLTEVNDGLVVALHIHHALYDAISLDLIVRRLKRLCSANNTGVDKEDEPVTNAQPFLNALQLHELGARRFWTSYLKDTSENVTSTSTFESPRTELFVPNLTTIKSIESIARGAGLGTQAILFSTIARVYAQAIAPGKGKHPDTTIVGLYLANRSLDVEGLSDLMAPTFNIVPLKVKTALSTNILEAAREIQADLQEITRAEHCGVSLRDIHAWTGILVDCYINFLRLPDVEAGTVRTKTQSGSEVEIRHAEGELREHAKALVRVEESISPYVREENVNEDDTRWCLPALDVEAKIDGDGTLAVGMFAPRDMFDEEGVSRLMEELRIALEDVAEA